MDRSVGGMDHLAAGHKRLDGTEMKIVGLMIARNEAWCIRDSLRAALAWCDAVHVVLHASTDATKEIVIDVSANHGPASDCLEHPALTYTIMADGAWNEATYRQHALEMGRLMGGTHFAIIDADEMVTAAFIEPLMILARSIQPGECIRPPWLQCWRSLENYRNDVSPFGRARTSFLFRDAPFLSYVADPGGYQLHKRVPSGVRYLETGSHGSGGVLHMQHASWDRVLWKQLLYQMDELLRWPGRRSAEEIAAQYSPTVDETGLKLTPIPDEWWPLDPSSIDLAAEPWQKAEVLRLIDRHGREHFQRLNFFGLA